jgi:TubC N-terminal docking domain
MDATALLTRLRQAGLTVSRTGDQLVVAPPDLLTDELRAAIRNAKREILEALTSEQSKVPVPSMPDLLDRIRTMAKRWGFSPKELTEELNRASADPARALSWVENDEAKFGAGETLNARH